MGTERIKRGQKLCLPDVTGPMGQFSNVESRTFHTAGTVHGVGGGWGLQHSGRLGPGEGAEAAGSTALSRDRGGYTGKETDRRRWEEDTGGEGMSWFRCGRSSRALGQSREHLISGLSS